MMQIKVSGSLSTVQERFRRLRDRMPKSSVESNQPRFSKGIQRFSKGI